MLNNSKWCLPLLVSPLSQCSFHNTSCSHILALLPHFPIIVVIRLHSSSTSVYYTDKLKWGKPGSKASMHVLQHKQVGASTFATSAITLSFNLLVQLVSFFSVFALTTRICPGLAEPVPDSSRRPLVHCEAINQAFLFYTAQYREGNSSGFPSVWVA